VRIALQNPAVRPVDSGGTCPADASCYDSHGYNFTATDDWVRMQLSFESMKQAGWGTPVGPFDPTQLFTVEFQFTAGGAYEIWLDDVGFYKEGDPVPPEPTPEAGMPMVDDDAPTGDDTPPNEAGVPPEMTPEASVPLVDAGDAGLPDVLDA